MPATSAAALRSPSCSPVRTAASGAAGTSTRPLFNGGHYFPDGIKDVIGYLPTSGVFDAGTATFTTSSTCSISGTSLTYTPNAEFFGTDSITVNEVDNRLILPGGGSAFDPGSLSLLVALPLLRRRRRA